jgi:SAM-dependent methyltransferase
MKRSFKNAARSFIDLLRGNQQLRFLMNQAAAHDILTNEFFLTGHSWKLTEPAFTNLRRQLFSDPIWRYGPLRIHEVASEGYNLLRDFTSIEGKTYCDLGCGTMHPLGIAAIFYLNGAAHTLSTDLFSADERRAAEALADLLWDCFCSMEKWCWSGNTGLFRERLEQFDILALRSGNLKTGTAKVPMRHVVTDIHSPSLQPNSIDLMSSRAVLEHFLDFGTAVRRLYDLMRPGGVAAHVIDIIDHRHYNDPEAFHYFSFLGEGDDWSDGLVNRLRSSEMKSHFQQAGFEILKYEEIRSEMPPGFREKIVGRFRAMSIQELSITGINCVLKKPQSNPK